MIFDRSQMRASLETQEEWDVIIVGGGATGLGAAVDSAQRGYKTLLLERVDFAKGTSSRSTKLVHGGVRYLKQGNISLVNEALRERGILRENAPHLVRNLAFIVPNYDWWSGPFYGIGLKLYDFLAGKMGLGPSRRLTKDEAIEALPNLNTDGLRGGVIYYDGQFDDARLALHLAMTAADHGAHLLNYMEVVGLVKDEGICEGVLVRDREADDPDELITIRGRVIINATGAFVDHLRAEDEPETEPLVTPSQGVHLVLSSEFLESENAIMVPETEDGRVLFAIPWYDKVVVGTTDTLVAEATLEPRPLEEELTFILSHAQKYLARPPREEDVLSCFAGLRPLVSKKGKKTSSISREHTIIISASGLVTITGGKWTTYRKMAEDVIDAAMGIGQLEEQPCQTHRLKLHGWMESDPGVIDSLSVYGADRVYIEALIDEDPSLATPLHERLPYREAEVVWAVKSEMARTVDDVLSRRTRALLLNAQAALDAAPRVAEIMALELNKDSDWIDDQLTRFKDIASGYLWPSNFKIPKTQLNDLAVDHVQTSDDDLGEVDS
jgi:glycerol-3-phosphate dehydrogenase